MVAGNDPAELPLWAGQVPDVGFSKVRELVVARRDGPWDFWIDWYQRALDGTPQPMGLLEKIAIQPSLFWDGTDGEVNTRIAEIVVEWEAGRETPLAKAYPVDFTFDELSRVMRMVGIADDTIHLRDPKVVQSFLDDCGELRDTLQNFSDFADAASGGGNRVGVLKLATDRVLDELRRTGDETHLRARHLVRLSHWIESFSKEEAARSDLGETLSGMLDDGLDLLRNVTRKHFSPAYTALAPLAELTLEQVDQDEVLAIFDNMIEWLESLPTNNLYELDRDGISVFRDMVREAREYRAAIAEADSVEFRALLEDRFAESAGGTGLAFGRFYRTSREAMDASGAASDMAIKNFKRAQGVHDILEALQNLPGGGAG